MVRYTVRPDGAEENTRLVEAVFESLNRSAPAGLTYSTYRMEDGVSFVHVATVENPDDNPLQKLAEFKAFTAGVKDRCEVPPATSVLTRIGSYTSK